MARIAKTLTNLYQGVSNQSPELRLEGQCQESINTSLTIPRGLEKRPSSDLVASHDLPAVTRDGYFYSYSRDENEKYLMHLNDNKEITVIKEDGTLCAVTFVGASDYLLTDDPKRDLRAVTIGDTTIISNRKIQPNWTDDRTPTTDKFAYVSITQNTTSSRLKFVRLDGTTYSSSADSATTSASNIASSIDALPNFTASVISGTSTMKIIKTDGTDFTIAVGDENGGSATELFKNTGGLRDDLPYNAIDGDVVRVTTEEGGDFDYYLQYDGNTSTWNETVAPDLQYKLDATTMPHKLTRVAVDTFEFEEIEWADQEVGDLDSIPDPSFISQPIVNLVFHKDRLGLLLKDGIVFSRTSDYFNHFPKTVLEVLDDDPIDETVSSNKVVTLLHTMPFPESLVLVGSEQQFEVHTGDRAFTPKNIIIDETTSKSAHDRFSPCKIGSSLFFTSPIERYSVLYQYQVDNDTNIGEATSMSSHVPRYIPKDLKQMIPSEALDMIFLLENDSNQVYIYTYFWQGNKLVQSCWNKWDFFGTIVGGACFDGNLNLWINGFDGDQVYVLSMDLESTERGYHLDAIQGIPDVDVSEEIIELPHEHEKIDMDFIQMQREFTVTLTGGAQYASVADVTPVLYNDETKAYYFLDRIEGDDLIFKETNIYNQSDTVEDIVDSTFLGVGNYSLGGVFDGK